MKIDWVDSEKITPDTAQELLGEADGIIVPGGFGGRGIEGMILAARYAREHHVPYFGICLGMQIAAIEWRAARWAWKTRIRGSLIRKPAFGH